MSFLAWTFLFGAFAIVGPIAAHLLAKPRFRRIGFTMLRFLRSGQRESHSRRKLRDLLVLLLRCAVIVLIAMLFAQPVLHVKSKPQRQRRMHYLALDDSMSMAYQDGQRSLFGRMIEMAGDHVLRAPDDDVFSIHALASGRSLRDLTKRQAIMEIKRLRVVPQSIQLADFFSALRQASQSASAGDVVSAVIISDFSPNALRAFERIQDPAVVADVQYEPVVASGPINNAAVVGARLVDLTENRLSMDVTVANYGPAGQRRTLTAQTANVSPVAIELDLAPQRSGVFRVQMDLGPGLGRTDRPYVPIELTLAPEDSLGADDIHRLAAYLPPNTSTNVLLVHQAEDTFLFETAIEALSRRGGAGRLSLRKVIEDRLTATDLNRADIVVFPSLPRSYSCGPGNIESVLARGGRLIFFATEVHRADVTRQLWRERLLPALPEKWNDEVTYPEAGCVTGTGLDFDERAARSLSNYRVDQIAMKGYWLCEVSSQAECVWRFGNGAGFVYGQSRDRGLSIFVNTSIDDSLGLLGKSRAWVAFCQYLLGQADQVQQFCFSTGDRPVLHLPDASWAPQARAAVWVENCDGSRMPARADGTVLRMPAPAGTGWMRTLNEPALYAAVNLPEGETDVSPPVPQAVADAVQRAFVINPDAKPAVTHAGSDVQRKPIWRTFAWVAILLLLFESALANRLRR